MSTNLPQMSGKPGETITADEKVKELMEENERLTAEVINEKKARQTMNDGWSRECDRLRAAIEAASHTAEWRSDSGYAEILYQALAGAG